MFGLTSAEGATATEGSKRAADSGGLQTPGQEKRRSLVHHKVGLFLHDELKEKFEMQEDTVRSQ